MAKSVATLTAILLVVTLTYTQEKAGTKPTAATDATLIANERALYDAVAKHDKTAFLSMALPSEGIWTTKGGFVPMDLLANGLDGFKLTKWEIVNPRVTWLGNDSAVVLYAWMGAGTFYDQTLTTTLASTVWTKRNGKWLAAHHQETDLTR